MTVDLTAIFGRTEQNEPSQWFAAPKPADRREAHQQAKQEDKNRNTDGPRAYAHGL